LGLIHEVNNFKCGIQIKPHHQKIKTQLKNIYIIIVALSLAFKGLTNGLVDGLGY
jgi:hypothetical protein